VVIINLAELVAIASSEEKTEEFLRASFDFCLFCNSTYIGKVRRNFFKCYTCRKECSIRKGSILEDLKIPLSKFILAVKLFILEVPMSRAYKELGIVYNQDKVSGLSQKIMGYYQER